MAVELAELGCGAACGVAGEVLLGCVAGLKMDAALLVARRDRP
ncbi:hypothetical protein [Pseudovibrio brasiliensis]|nr:hypothetical protein [Pseudovibrio brasiliensis]